MIRQRQADRLATWLKQVKADALGELKSFAAGLRRDYGAVLAGLSRKENNGQVEGQITRLKLLKRQSMAVPGLICYACECSMPLRDDLLQQQDCLFERQTLQKAYET